MHTTLSYVYVLLYVFMQLLGFGFLYVAMLKFVKESREPQLEACTDNAHAVSIWQRVVQQSCTVFWRASLTLYVMSFVFLLLLECEKSKVARSSLSH